MRIADSYFPAMPDVGTPKYAPVMKQQTTNSPNITVDMSGIQVVANNPKEFTDQMKNAMKNDRSVRLLVNDIAWSEALGKTHMLDTAGNLRGCLCGSPLYVVFVVL